MLKEKGEKKKKKRKINRGKINSNAENCDGWTYN
jgi:hypothetical protein